LTLQVFEATKYIRCINCNQIIAKLQEALPSETVVFCSDHCDAVHNGKLSTMVIRYREGLKQK
jgi:hypothetical protein